MNPSPARLLAVAIWLAFVAVSAGWILLGGRTGKPLVETVPFTLVYGAFATMGALVAARRPDNPIGWIMAAAGLGTNTGNMLLAYAARSLGEHGGSLPLTHLAAWVGNWIWPASIVSLVFVVLLFPTGKPASPRWAYVVRGAYLGIGCLVFSFLFKPGPLDVGPDEAGPTRIHNPVGIELGPLEPVLGIVGGMSVPVALILGLISLFLRAARSHGVERQQVKIFLYAVGVLVLLNFAGTPVLAQSLPDDHPLRDVTFLVGLTMIPLGAGLAILRYGLYDIDVVVNKTLVYGSLTAILAGCYLGAIVVLPRVSPVGADSDLAVAASTLAVAALFQPLRSRVQGFIDRRFYLRKYDAGETLEAFSARLRDQVDLDALGRQLVFVVGATMQPAHASLWLRQREVGE